MDADIVKTAQALKGKAIARRRDLHKHAEAAWTEFRTASIVATELAALGYRVLAGAEVVEASAMMGVPPAADLEQHLERALAQGADPVWVEKMRGGKTGVVGVMTFGRPGPTVALRVDMDANDLGEATEEKHRPPRGIRVGERRRDACVRPRRTHGHRLGSGGGFGGTPGPAGGDDDINEDALVPGIALLTASPRSC